MRGQQNIKFVLIVLLGGLELLILYVIVISFVSQATEFSHY
jgi:hypothetical protein